jgi:hypothetical protein
VITIKKFKIIFKVLEVLLIIVTLVSPVFLNCLGAYGMISNANENLNGSTELIEYYQTLMHNMVYYGYAMIFSSILMVVSVVLYFCKLNIIPMVTQSTGFSICMVVMVKISAIADKYGLTDSEMQPLSEKYFNRHFITIVPLVLLLLLCLLRFFSYDSRSQRKQKKLDKIARDNAPCEKIID